MGYAGSQFHRGPNYLQDPLTPLTVTIYSNTEQECTNTCPEGTSGEPITVTVPAGTYTSTFSQEAADALALAAACAAAAAEREQNPCEIPNVLWAWGRNDSGSLGVGNTVQQDAPIIIGYSALEWSDIAGGGNFAIGIKGEGSLWSWGANYEGQLGLGTQSIFPSTANNKLYPTQIGSDLDWVAIAAGEQCAAAIKSDGTLWTWGYNGDGQLGHGDTTDRLVPTQVGADTDWASVAASADYIMAVKTDGTLWGSGANAHGQLGDGTMTPNQVFIQIGTDTDWASIAVSNTGVSTPSTCGIKTTGTLWTWGSNANGQLGKGTTGGNVLSPEQRGSDTDWLKTAGGDQFNIALKTTGELWGTGWNFVGQLGLGDLTARNTFTRIGSDTDWDGVSCGEYFTSAKKTTGELFGWGQNTLGQLGQGLPSGAHNTAVQMGSDDKWKLVRSGFSSCYALRTDLTDPAPPAGNNGVASGGIYSESGGNSIHRFDSNGSFTVYADTAMDYAIIGGGGAGGGIGGGGAGQFQKFTGIVVPAGTYAVAVAQRAFCALGGEDRGGNGGSASFNSSISVGGGGGGAVSDTLGTGADGACGGGGGYLATLTMAGQLGGNGSDAGSGGAGFGNGSATGAGGGGGGNAGNGANGSANTGGAGAAGVSDSITGSSVKYCAGGGGAGNTTGGSGGSTGAGGKGSDQTTPSTPGVTAGSGGGGTLSNFWPIGTDNGDGAYGTVIISYPTPP